MEAEGRWAHHLPCLRNSGSQLRRRDPRGSAEYDSGASLSSQLYHNTERALVSFEPPKDGLKVSLTLPSDAFKDNHLLPVLCFTRCYLAQH